MKKNLFIIILSAPFILLAQWEQIPGIKGSVIKSFDVGTNIAVANIGRSWEPYYTNVNEINWKNITKNSEDDKNLKKSLSKIRIIDSIPVMFKFGKIINFNFEIDKWEDSKIEGLNPLYFEVKMDTIFTIEQINLNSQTDINDSLVLNNVNFYKKLVENSDTLIIKKNGTDFNNYFFKIGSKLYFYNTSNNNGVRSNNILKINFNNKFEKLVQTGLPKSFRIYIFCNSNDNLYCYLTNYSNPVNYQNEIYSFDGVTWKPIQPPVESETIKYFSASNNMLFLFYGQFYYISNDKGLTWTKILYNLKQKLEFYENLRAFNVINNMDNTINLIPSDNGFISTNSFGLNMKFQNKGISSTWHLGLGNSKGNLITSIIYDKVFERNKKSRIWTEDTLANINYPFNDTLFSQFDVNFLDTKYNKEIYAKSSNQAWRNFYIADSISEKTYLIGKIHPSKFIVYYNNNLYQSTDSGSSWLPLNQSYKSLPLSKYTSIIGNPAQYIWREENQVFYSLNKGENWQEAMEGLPENVKINKGLYDTKWGPAILAKKTGVPYDSIYFFNMGRWKGFGRLEFPKAKVKDLMEVNGNLILQLFYLSPNLFEDSNKIFISKNLGKSFEFFGDGLPKYSIYRGIVADEDSLYIATEGQGIYKIKIPDSVPDSIGTYLTSVSIQNPYLIFPNPSNGKIIIKDTNQENHLITFELRDVGGRLILRKETINLENNFNITLNQLQSGLYFYSIIENSLKTFQGKIILCN